MEGKVPTQEEDEVFIEYFGWVEEDFTTNGNIELSNNAFPGQEEHTKLQQPVSRGLELLSTTSSSSMLDNGAPSAAATAAALQSALQTHMPRDESINHDDVLSRPLLSSEAPRLETCASLAAAPSTLPVLVQQLLQPGRATDETNDICISIMLHPDLAKDPTALGLYSKMSGGLRNYTMGTSHAWLYTPRKHPNRTSSSSSEDPANNLALIFVFPDEIGATDSGRREMPADKSRNKLHFGGRAFPLWNNSVLLQHGAHKPLGCVQPQRV